MESVARRLKELFVPIHEVAYMADEPRGGVARASSFKVVNIAGGGGLAPLIPRSIYQELIS